MSVLDRDEPGGNPVANQLLHGSSHGCTGLSAADDMKAVDLPEIDSKLATTLLDCQSIALTTQDPLDTLMRIHCRQGRSEDLESCVFLCHRSQEIPTHRAAKAEDPLATRLE